MSLRNALERRPWMTGLIACADVGLGALRAYRYASPVAATPPQQVWYYDLDTGRLFIAVDQLPPIAAPDDKAGDPPSGVRAFVTACGDCLQVDQRHIAFLQTFPTDVQAELGGSATTMGDAVDHSAYCGSLVKRPDDREWVDIYSEEGEQVRLPAACPDGNPLRNCQPR